MESLHDFTHCLCMEFRNTGRYGTSRAFLCTLRCFETFQGHPETSFCDLNSGLLKRFEQYLFSRNCRRNTISLYLRLLRSIYNRAVESGIAPASPCLFRDVFTGTDSSTKRAVNPQVIRQLLSANLEAFPDLCECRDFFLLSFYLRGIPFVDLIRLRRNDISRGVLRYRRSKTGRLLTVRVEPCAAELLNRYSSCDNYSPYLLNILDEVGENGYRQYQSALRLYNYRLAKLSRKLKLKISLSSYTARHSWATAAYHHGISVAVISESLGHASEKVTYTYLASFDERALSNANRKVIASVRDVCKKNVTPASIREQETILQTCGKVFPFH